MSSGTDSFRSVAVGDSSQSNEERLSFASDDGGPEWRLNILYGRDEESKTIQEVADKRSTNILVLHGASGSGKSSLIEQQPWEQMGWIFASGKYEQGRMNARSTDAHYTELIANLRQKLNLLAGKIAPKVYEHGFLKK